MNARAWRFSLRAAAITIALTAAIDPAVTSNRKTRPVISLVTAHARDTVLAARLARALDKQFTVVRAPLAAANASVIVGDNLPAGASELARPVFAATAERAGPTVTIESAEAPASSPTAARVPVAALAHITGARGR
ncbi:MAG: hypothetical protein ACREPM_00395, partial [Gemmatimonadaceae bacterium]